MENDIKLLLSESGFSFKKKFGQNFITDKNLLAAIVAGSGAGEEDTVVEIGCGAGTLTRELALRCKRVIGYEIDRTLRPVLERTLSGLDNAEVRFQDFLKVDVEIFEQELTSYSVVANLPYYITTPLIMKFAESSEKCTGLCVMVQEEVADRLCARAGTPEYGAVTAMLALRGSCSVVRRVPRTMFYPRPEVDSAVVRISFSGGLQTEDSEKYKKVVRAAFSSRRKTLENNLVNAFRLTREEARAALEASGIDCRARGETLTPEQFSLLSANLPL